MIKWFERIMGIERLKQQNDELKRKLEERQEVINKTNSYWKGIVRNLKKQKS